MWFLRRHQNKSGEEAEAALKEATEKLIEVQERGEEITEISNALRDIRERNHFGEQLEELLMLRRRSFR